ncbi:MAG: sigma-E processing peptidase SpoIIGA [Clostridia bacterium]
MSVVYIDVLFGVNLFLNYIMLRAAGAVCKNRPPRWRTLIGAAVGAGYAIAMFFPNMSLFYSLIFKLLASMLIIAVSFPIYGIWEFFRLLGMFYGVTAAFGGLSFALFFLTGWGAKLGAVYSNGIMYLDIPVTALFLGAVAFYGFLCLISYALKLKRRLGSRRKVIVELGGKTAVLTALADTGNILVDPISRAPVIVAELDALKELFDYSTRVSLCSDNLQTGLGSMAENGVRARLIPFSSVGEGDGMMVGFIPDRAAIREGGGLRPMESCVIGVYPKRLSADKSYDALYNPN